MPPLHFFSEKIDESSALRSTIRKFRNLKDKKGSTYNNISDKATNEIILSFDIPNNTVNNDNEVNCAGDGPPPSKKTKSEFVTSNKDFDELSERQKRDITKPLVLYLEHFIENSDFSIYPKTNCLDIFYAGKMERRKKLHTPMVNPY